MDPNSGLSPSPKGPQVSLSLHFLLREDIRAPPHPAPDRVSLRAKETSSKQAASSVITQVSASCLRWAQGRALHPPSAYWGLLPSWATGALAGGSGQLMLLPLPCLGPCWGHGLPSCPQAQPRPSGPQIKEAVGVGGGKETWRGLAPCQAQPLPLLGPSAQGAHLPP